MLIFGETLGATLKKKLSCFYNLVPYCESVKWKIANNGQRKLLNRIFLWIPVLRIWISIESVNTHCPTLKNMWHVIILDLFKNSKQGIYEIPELLSWEWRNPAESGAGKYKRNIVVRFLPLVIDRNPGYNS